MIEDQNIPSDDFLLAPACRNSNSLRNSNGQSRRDRKPDRALYVPPKKKVVGDTGKPNLNDTNSELVCSLSPNEKSPENIVPVVEKQPDDNTSPNNVQPEQRRRRVKSRLHKVNMGPYRSDEHVLNKKLFDPNANEAPQTPPPPQTASLARRRVKPRKPPITEKISASEQRNSTPASPERVSTEHQSSPPVIDIENPGTPFINKNSPMLLNIHQDIPKTQFTFAPAILNPLTQYQIMPNHLEVFEGFDRSFLATWLAAVSGPSEAKLAEFIAKEPISELDKISEQRNRMKLSYETIIYMDIEYANQNNVEQALWKNIFYQLIERLRKALDQSTSSQTVYESIKQLLINVIEEGISFYSNILLRLQKDHGFSLDDYYQPMAVLRISKTSKKMFYPLMTCMKVLVNLGDLYRYQGQTVRTQNFGKAREYYLKAQKLQPKNGRPYNQLALLALYTKRRLDAVYFFMRSVSALDSFQSARESLNTIFEDVRRKVSSQMKKRNEEVIKEKPVLPSRRREIWTLDESSGKSLEVSDHTKNRLDRISEVSMLENLPSSELYFESLNKQFVLSFLHVHGKLFTNIGMESFEEAVGMVLCQFQLLLNQNPLPTSHNRLLQLVIINIFAVHNCNIKSDVNESVRSLEQCAVMFGMLIMQLILDRATEFLKALPSHFHDQPFTGEISNWVLPEDLRSLLPSIKLWSDWMICNNLKWNPLPQSHLGCWSVVDIWTSYSKFLSSVDRISTPSLFLPQATKDCQVLVLEEHVMVAGFKPHCEYPVHAFYIGPNYDQSIAEDAYRIESVKLFGEYLSGLERPPIVYDCKQRVYLANSVVQLQSFHDDHSDSGSDGGSVLDIIGRMTYMEVNELKPTTDPDITALREKKFALQNQLDDQERISFDRQSVLREERSIEDITLIVEPYHLVIDTNTMLHSLSDIDDLICSRRFCIIVPLIVTSELEGLSRGAEDRKVRKEALDGLKFLERIMQSPDLFKYIRVITSRGSHVHSLKYKTEQLTESSNDDTILKACTFFYSAESSKPVGEANIIRRRVVLITEDRNLRVKAISKNIPALSMTNFFDNLKILLEK